MEIADHTNENQLVLAVGLTVFHIVLAVELAVFHILPFNHCQSQNVEDMWSYLR